ncbi:MAG: hypothetical protein FHK82_17485 [Sedimenticola thiotaurini]|uniref:Uncharacterized protein n=1 Tax=Sedimenticola thiotaurini TaxID=1543721 RepID=A0A558CJC9_9GAMM|nr:MAG: hypothetical protein FHK82_17485 [Sedimenticola thiotaurini]
MGVQNCASNPSLRLSGQLLSQATLTQICRAIAEATTVEQTQTSLESSEDIRAESWPCPDCQVGRLYSVGEIAPKRLNGG